MAQTFEDRVEEVLGELHGMAWPLLEEAEKKKIVAKVVRGVDRYEDSVASWGRALGVSRQTLSNRIERFRRSEPIDGAALDRHNTTGRALRGARQVLRDPELAAELMQEPAIRRAILDAAREVADVTVAHEHAEPTVPEAWDAWLTQGNTWLTKGARLMDRTEGRLEGHAGFGPVLYRRLPTWKKTGQAAANADDHEMARLCWQAEHEISTTGFVSDATHAELFKIFVSRGFEN